jgi:hypothetical protein
LDEEPMMVSYTFGNPCAKKGDVLEAVRVRLDAADAALSRILGKQVHCRVIPRNEKTLRLAATRIK